MKDDKYIPQMLFILSDAQESGLISASEEKRLADNLIDNKTADIVRAQLTEVYWDYKDELEGIGYYKN